MSGILSTIPGAVCQGLIWGILAIGVFVTFKILNIADLTVDGSICTGAAVCTVLMISGYSPVFSVFCAFLAGALAGTLTGLLNVLFGIPAILSGILVQMILWSVNLKILGKANLSLSARSYPVIITQISITKSLIILCLITVLLVAVLYVFFSTEIGFCLRSTGSNENMSLAQGVNTPLMKVIGLSLSNGIVALSGALLCQYQGFTDINMGRGAIVIGLAAVVIGTALLRNFSKNFGVKFLFVSLGGVVYYIIYQVIIFTGFDTDLLKMLSALVVAVFLGVPYIKSRSKIILSRKRCKSC